MYTQELCVKFDKQLQNVCLNFVSATYHNCAVYEK